jgi:hypothetical protein
MFGRSDEKWAHNRRIYNCINPFHPWFSLLISEWMLSPLSGLSWHTACSSFDFWSKPVPSERSGKDILHGCHDALNFQEKSESGMRTSF